MYAKICLRKMKNILTDLVLFLYTNIRRLDV